MSTQIRNGVKLGEGDGTVSLLSLGAMCVEGWKRKRWNPAGIKITTVEVRVLTHLRTSSRVLSLKPFELDGSYLISQRQPCREVGPTPVIMLMSLGPTR
jgi:hypothetical protein